MCGHDVVGVEDVAVGGAEDVDGSVSSDVSSRTSVIPAPGAGADQPKPDTVSMRKWASAHPRADANASK